jgi:hypothetical protein
MKGRLPNELPEEIKVLKIFQRQKCIFTPPPQLIRASAADHHTHML